MPGRAGPATTWQSSRPYEVAGRTRFDALVVHLPRHLLRPHADRLCAATARTLDGDGAVGALVARYLRQVTGGLDDGTIGAPARDHLAEGLLDLMRALCLPDRPAPAPRRAAEELRARVDAYIEGRLGDPALDADAIARAHFISRSYLNRLYAGDGVRQTIKARRLERARRDLADPALAAEPVLDVAMRWGFASRAHFSRSFRARYGVSPSAVRPAP